MDYGKELFYERVKRRLNQAEVSKATGVSVPTLIDVEKNRLIISAQTFNKMLRAIIKIAEDKEKAA